jgi:hypothetical protein
VIENGTLIVHDYNCQCANCGYGGDSWTDSPALEDKPILTPESKECPGCGVKFEQRRLSVDLDMVKARHPELHGDENDG